MSTINYHKREIVAKVVYYGPGLGGKTTSLEHIHSTAKGVRGDLISLTTDEDRTLYFDYLPVELPKLGGFTVRMQLYTVPGQVYYNATRKLVLDGADGVVFVADSQKARMSANVESLDNLCENLREKNFVLKGLPQVVTNKTAPAEGAQPPGELSWIIQYNKRDVADPITISTLESQLNLAGVPAFETVATEGKGVLEALQSICTMVLADVRDKGRMRESRAQSAVTRAEGNEPAVEKQGSMTATSLADITDVVANLSTDGTSSAEAHLEEEPVTRPGAPARSSADPASDDDEEDDDAATITKRHAPGVSSLDEPADQSPTSPGLDAVTSTDLPAVSAQRGYQSLGLSQLIASPGRREALASVEEAVVSSNWLAAVQGAHAAFSDLAASLARIKAPENSVDPMTFAALLTAMPAERLLRFRRTVASLEDPEAIGQEEAVFALFFLADFALRVDDLARAER